MDVLDFLIDPLRSGIDRRALLELALVGGFCGALGFWVVTERLAYSAESLSHGLLPGLVLLALAPESPQRLEELLFGDPLGVTDGDLAAAAALLVLGAAALVALHRPFSAVAFDATGAAAAGLRPAVVRLVLLVLLAAAVAVAVQGLGALLVLAVLIGPPLAVRNHARTGARVMLGGAAVAVLAGVVGIEVSFHAHSATGASVALALCAAAALGSAFRRSPGAARPDAWPRSQRRGPPLPGR